MNGPSRRAEWVWRRRELRPPGFVAASLACETEANLYVYFRKRLVAPDTVEAAPVAVSADGAYVLFVNGVRVGRGPARCHPAWQSYDEYDLAEHLAPGENVIAALVHCYGRATSWYRPPSGEAARAFGCGGFFLQGEVVGPSIRLDTGPSWRHAVSDAWRRDAPAGSLGFTEIYDARRAPSGWASAGFDDSAWEEAQVLRVPGFHFSSDVVPFPVMEPRGIPAPVERERPAARVAALAEVAEDASPDVATALAGERFAPISACSASGIAGLLNGEASADIRTAPGRAVSFVLDFGGVVAGRPLLELAGPGGAVVDLACGEELERDGRVRLSSGIPGLDVPPAHRYVLREGTQSWERFGWSGFRYLQVTVRGAEPPVTVRSARVVETGYPLERRGAFRCSDPLLTRLWEAGARTVALCMHDAYVDCPSREQRQWAGDASVEALVNYAAFGDAALAARFLREVARSQRSDGLTGMAVPGDFGAADFAAIPDFCLAWIQAVGRHVHYTGDEATGAALYPAVRLALDWFERHRAASGLLADVPHWIFLDWAELGKAGEVTALNAQLADALRVAASLARLAGAPAEAARFEGARGEVVSAINGQLWDEQRGVYADCRRGGALSRRVSQHANAAAVAFGVAPPERWERIFAAILDEGRLVRTRRKPGDPPVPFDEESNVVLAQPFFAHHLHRALARAGLHEALLANIRARWGPMLEGADEPTFWETWNAEELSSRCHGYAATPTFDLSTEVLGVTPAAPGFRRVRVAPRPAGLTWAEGAFPTPRGPVAVSWRAGDPAGAFSLDLDVPPGSEAEVTLPEEHAGGAIALDGRRLDDGARMPVLGPGAHTVRTAGKEAT